DPGARHGRGARGQRPQVVDLVTQGDPRPAGPLFGGEPRVPVRRAGLLQPADIDHIVDVAVLVDVLGTDGQRQDEDLAALARRQLPLHAGSTPFSASSGCSSPAWNISRTMS